MYSQAKSGMDGERKAGGEAGGGGGELQNLQNIGFIGFPWFYNDRLVSHWFYSFFIMFIMTFTIFIVKPMEHLCVG